MPGPHTQRLQECHNPHRHCSTPGLGGKEALQEVLGRGTHKARLSCPQASSRGRSSDMASHLTARGLCPNSGSTHQQPLRFPGCPQDTGPFPTPALDPQKLSQPWVQAEHRPGPKIHSPHSGTPPRTHLSQTAGTSRRAARLWPCWSSQQPWHHPRLEEERANPQHRSHLRQAGWHRGPGQPLWAQTQPGHPRACPTQQGGSTTNRHPWGSLSLLVNHPCTAGDHKAAPQERNPLQLHCRDLKSSELSRAVLSSPDSPPGWLQLTLT